MQTQQYFAFISYSRRDEANAKWLHRALESYTFPRGLALAALNDEAPASRHLRPVFRDTDELSASSDIGAALRQRLDQSRYLIVLCSQASAASRWVNEEVKYWLSLGRSESILTIYVDSIPTDDTARNALLPADLRRHCAQTGVEPLSIAIDRRRSDALLRVAAPLAGVDYARLVDRHAKRRRRRATLAAVAVAGVAAVGVLTGQYWLETQRQSESQRLSGSAGTSRAIEADTRILLAAHAYDLARTPASRNALLSLIAPGLHSIRHAHAGIISAVAFSDDGHWLLTGGRDGKVVLWDTATMQPTDEHQFEILGGAAGVENPVRRVGFLPDLSGWVAVPNDGPFMGDEGEQLEPRQLDAVIVVPMPGSKRSAVELTAQLDLNTVSGWRDFEPGHLNRPDLGMALRVTRSGSIALFRGVAAPSGDPIVDAFHARSGNTLVMWTAAGAIHIHGRGSEQSQSITDRGALSRPAISADDSRVAWIGSKGLWLFDRRLGKRTTTAFTIPQGQRVLGFEFDPGGDALGVIVGSGDDESDRSITTWRIDDRSELHSEDLTGLLPELLYHAGLIGDGGGRYSIRGDAIAVQQSGGVSGLSARGRTWQLGRGMHAFPFEWDHSATAVLTADCLDGARYAYGEECGGTLWNLTDITGGHGREPGTTYIDPYLRYEERGRVPPTQIALGSENSTFLARRGARQIDLYAINEEIRLMASHLLEHDIASIQAHPTEPQRYLVVTRGGFVFPWDVREAAIRTAACTIVGRDFSDEERRAHGIATAAKRLPEC